MDAACLRPQKREKRKVYGYFAEISVQAPRSTKYNLNPLTEILGCRQVVRHGVLISAFVGSNPTIPAIYLT